MTSAIAAALHYLALGVGLGAVFARGRALRAPFDRGKLEALFLADNWYGIAAILWIGSGLWRLLGGLEKGTGWYLSNPMFHLKATLYTLAACFEMWPMVTFIRWRIAIQKGKEPDFSAVRYFRVLNMAEVCVIVIMVFAASAMSRGIGYTSRKTANQSPACVVEEVARTTCKSCHNPTTLLGGMDVAGGVQKAFVNTRSSQWSSETRAIPGHPESSLLIKKLRGTHGDLGGPMPPGNRLPDSTIVMFEKWITDGCPECSP